MARIEPTRRDDLPAGEEVHALGAVRVAVSNVIERGFNAFKRRRGLASRYDKLAINYRGGAVLRAIIMWTSDLCVTP